MLSISSQQILGPTGKKGARVSHLIFTSRYFFYPFLKEQILIFLLVSCHIPLIAYATTEFDRCLTLSLPKIYPTIGDTPTTLRPVITLESNPLWRTFLVICISTQGLALHPDSLSLANWWWGYSHTTGTRPWGLPVNKHNPIKLLA